MFLNKKIKNEYLWKILKTPIMGLIIGPIKKYIKGTIKDTIRGLIIGPIKDHIKDTISAHNYRPCYMALL